MSTHALARIPRSLRRELHALKQSYRERNLRPRLRPDPSAPALLLSPHLDDAVLSCWSVLCAEGELNVVNIFAGEPSAPGRVAPWDLITGASDSATRVRERIAEDVDALQHAGRAPINLPLLDAQYRRPSSAPDLRELDQLVNGAVQSACRVYAPAGIGAHPDHLLTRRYARVLLRAGVPVSLYAELPYCILHGWPNWVDGREPQAFRNVDAFWAQFLSAVPELAALSSAQVTRLHDGAAMAKLAAMSCYATQLQALDYGARGLLADPAIHRYEVRWDLELGAG